MAETHFPAKTLWRKEAYLAQILAGRKTIEVRVGYENIRRLGAGDRLLLNGVHPYVIVRVALYPDFEALLAAEDAARIAPALPPGELLASMRRIYPPEKEALGAVALAITPESERPEQRAGE
jgi:ASC-1-like (ASCH) protein